MRIALAAAPALLVAGAAAAQVGGQADPRNAAAKVPQVEFRSAFEGYRPYAEQDLRDWRKSNEEVGAAGGHAGLNQGPGKQTPKPQPGKPGHGAHK